MVWGKNEENPKTRRVMEKLNKLKVEIKDLKNIIHVSAAT